MSEKDTTDSTAAKPETPADGQTFKIQRIYLKDCSYESPQTPKVFTANTNWQPSVSLHLNTETAKQENDLFESVLTVTVTVKLADEVAYLIEVKQAGLFHIQGFPDERMAPMLGSFCPNILFPFAREEIASLVQKGGFPQLLLDPVNFDALYAQHVASAKQNAPSSDTPQ